MKRVHALLVIVLAVIGATSLLWLTESTISNDCDVQRHAAPAVIAADSDDQSALVDAALIAQARCQQKN